MKAIENLTIEELKALEKALAFTMVRHIEHTPMYETWKSLLVDVVQQISDQEFERDNGDEYSKPPEPLI